MKFLKNGWIRVYLLPAAVLVLGLLISFQAFHAVRRAEGQKLTWHFQEEAEARIVSLQKELESQLDALWALQAYFSSTDEINRSAFKSFSRIVLQDSEGIQALAWAPRVPAAARSAFEEGVRREGIGQYQINERRDDKKIIPAGLRSEYFPVLFAEPAKDNEAALGLDLSSEAKRRAALEHSRETGIVAASAAVRLFAGSPGEMGFLAFAPVFRTEAAAPVSSSRRRVLSGFAVGVFRIGVIVGRPSFSLESIGSLAVYDRSEPVHDQLVYADGNKKAINAPADRDETPEYGRTIQVADRGWHVVCKADPQFMNASRTWQPLGTLMAGAAISILSSLYLLGLFRRTGQIESLVRERTGQLSRANEELEREVSARQQAESDLEAANKDLEARVENRTLDLGRANGRLQEEVAERQQTQEKLAASLKEKEVLLKEIHHRVKNNLQVISSLLSIQGRYLQDGEARKIFKESQERVRTMALIHEKLYRSGNLGRIDFGGYLRELVGHLASSYSLDSERVRLRLEAQEVWMEIAAAVPCGLIVNELVSNAFKYAFPEERRGEVRIDLWAEGGSIGMRVKDDGAGFPEGLDFRTTKTLGLELVVMLVEQLEGTIELRRQAGTEFRMNFPEGQERKEGWGGKNQYPHRGG